MYAHEAKPRREEKCVAKNNPARKIFEFILAGAGLVRKKSKFSPLGPVWFCQNIKILAKMYKFLAMVKKKT